MNRKISQVLLYIDNHYIEPVPLRHLASQVDMHPDYLSRCFKREVGMRVHQYLLLRRIERARHLLAQSTYSVREIAAQVGFSNSEVFSRAFKRLIGCSPRVYRQRVSWPAHLLVVQQREGFTQPLHK